MVKLYVYPKDLTMEQLTLQHHPKVLAINGGNIDKLWKGGRGKGKKMECMLCHSIVQEL